MKKGKKIISMILLASLLCSGLTACGNSTDSEKQTFKQPEMKGEISVSVYQSTEWLEMAVQLFEDKYPDLKVNIQPFYTGTDTFTLENGGAMINDRPAGQKKEDYATWLNTRLLSGNAGDIVITSEGLPVDKYKYMGVFEDLTPYLESAEEIKEENYYMNIFHAYQTESGSLYQFPVSAMPCPLFTFDREIVEETGLFTEEKSLTWREALTLAEEMYDASSLSGKCLPEPRSLLGNIFTKEVIASMDYEKGEINLREKELVEILEAFDEFGYYDIYGYGEDPRQVLSFPYTPDVDCAGFALGGKWTAVQWKHSDGKVYLSPYFTTDFGINSKSENKPLAWEFLKFLIADEVQTLPAFPYAGINKNGLKARVETYCKSVEGQEYKAEEVLSMIDSWLVQIDGYRAEDTDLIQIGDAILQDFMDGKLTAEEAVKQVEFRLEQYLSE